LPKAWVRERKREYFYRRAKEEKLRSRAAYKLLQAVKKYKFVKEGYIVVDLGAAPGGWTQATLRLVGSSGFVLAVDLKQIEPLDSLNVRSIVGDVSESQTVQKVHELVPRLADAVISDVSPNVSGIWELDSTRQIDLARNSLQIAAEILKSGGNFFVKVFQGSTLNEFVDEVKQYFRFVKLVKPKASRAKSSELYVLGMNYRHKI
jgi:23S rRNA (uridine2552-2'-O)-methyltransferase